MATISYVVPTPGTDLNALADPEIATALTTLKTAFNGNIDAVNLSALLAQAAGVNQNAQVVKGATNIATSESRTNTAYGLMPTSDQVTGLVLPTNGLIAVWYQATWSESVQGAGQATLFLGANQVKVASPFLNNPTVQSATIGSPTTAGTPTPLGSQPLGLASASGNGGGTYTGDVTTGQIVGGGNQPITGGAFGIGGPCYIFAAAGTYTVSVQFKASSGSVTVLNRKLWCQVLSFS